jgi:hypothetical protein
MFTKTIIIKSDFKQRWSSSPSLSIQLQCITITSHLKSLKVKKRMDMHKYTPLDNWISNSNTDTMKKNDTYSFWECFIHDIMNSDFCFFSLCIWYNG